MALIFGWNAGSNSVDATYSTNGKHGQTITFTGPTISADAGAIGGKSLDCSATTAARQLNFKGKNFANGRAFSLLIRMKPNYTGTPAAARSIFSLLGGDSNICQRFGVWHANTTGNLTVLASNEAGTIINSVSVGAWSPTSGTWYDLAISWDGTTTANSFKVYIDAVLQGSGITPTGAWSASTTREYWKSFGIGSSYVASTTANFFEELMVWDTTTDFASNINLVGGAGLANGASRTTYVSDVAGAALTTFDGLQNTGPGDTNVKAGTTWYLDGVLHTGTEPASDGGSHCASNLNWSN